MKKHITLTSFISLCLLFTACGEKSKENKGTEFSDSEPEISRVLARAPFDNESTVFKGTVLEFSDMVYPRFQFDLQDSSGNVKQVFFNVVDFPEFESKMSQGIIGREMAVTLKNISHPSLVKIVFPLKEKTYTPYPDSEEWAQEETRYQLFARFREEIIHEGDIYEEWVVFDLENGEQVRFEGAPGIDTSFAGEEAVVTYYFELKEEVTDVEISEEDFLGREQVIGPSIELTMSEVTLPEEIAGEVYQDVMDNMDADEELFEEYKDNPAKLFLAKFLDLNEDGVPEIIVTQSSENYWCYSSNCPIWIYARSENKYKKILFDFIADYEILVHKTNNYHDFVTIGHGSSVTSYNNIFAFHEGEYNMEKCVLETYYTDEEGFADVSYSPCDN